MHESQEQLSLALFPPATAASPPHTPDHLDCPACDLARMHAMGFDPDSLLPLTFAEAASRWLQTRKPYLRPRTYELYGQHLRQLNRFFARLVVRNIHLGHLREYQRARSANADGVWMKKAGPSIINHEISAVEQILKRAGRWDHFKEYYEPLPLPRRRAPKALSDIEEIRLFGIAASCGPEVWLAFWVASITANTGAAGTELRHLRHQEIHLEDHIPWLLIQAETAKNEQRGRIVCINKTAVKMLQLCIGRARSLGSYKPEHYLFPFRVAPGVWDASRPTSSSWLRRPWEKLRRASDLPWLTPHCLRHHHITLSYESGEPEQQIMDRVGHSSPWMTRHYSHTRRERQMIGVNAIDPEVRFATKVPPKRNPQERTKLIHKGA